MKTFLFVLFFFISTPFSFADQISKVTSVVDGDTVQLGDQGRVTLAGIDAPEVYPNRKLYDDARRNGVEYYQMMGLGKEARLFLEQMVKGRKIRIETDVEEKNGRGDLLGYAFLKVCAADCKFDPVPGHEYVKLDDGTYDFLNATLVKSGFAEARPDVGGLKYRNLFSSLQKQAQNDQAGFWVQSRELPR